MRARSRRGTRKRITVAMIATGVLMFVSPVAVLAQAEKYTGFYNLRAEANGVSATFGNPGVQPYPTAAWQAPETAADLSNGPQAHALSAIGWPGPLVGNVGGLAAVVFPLCDPDGSFCIEKPSDETVGLANYPLRAEAFSPGGQKESQLGPLWARAIDDDSDARATIADFGSSSVVSAGRINTRSHTFLDVGRGTSVAETVMTDIVAAGGQVKIKSLRSFASAWTDGIRTSVERETVVKGLEIGGHSATVDEEGVRFTDAASDPINRDLLSHFGIEMFLTRPSTEQTSGGEARLRTGSLAILWKLGDGGQQVLVTLGGAFVHVQGSGALVPPSTDPGSDFGPFTTKTDPTSTSVSGSGTGSGDGSTAADPAAGSTPAEGSSGAVALPPAQPARFFGGIGIGWFIVSLLGAFLAGGGLHRARAGVLTKDPDLHTSCPLERR